ncbi:uncharacterized protein [Nicotiana sylvestris]|uniref:uncharacterized protein n=1 Tax=Nicotiana sylvestris TaxID=4096 RepID=UPI00388C4EAE
MVVPKMNFDSEEDTDGLAYASFIRQNEALESALKKSKRSKRKIRLVKDGKIVHEKVIPVVNVDEEEEEEEPTCLTHKSSKQNHSHSQSIRHTSTNAESPSKSVDAASSEKLVKKSGDKTVKESGDKSNEEVEKFGEHMHKKSVEKGKSICKSVKRKMDNDEEPGSIKKAKVSEFLSFEKRLRNQKLVKICDSKKWPNLFTNEIPKVYEEEAKVGTKKQSFSKTTLEEYECIDKVGGVGKTSTISQLINAQNSATEEMWKLKARNTILESQLSQLKEALGSSSYHSSEVARLTKKNVELRK